MAADFSWNINASLNWINSHAYAKSQGACAKYVRMAIEAGGLSTAGRPVAAQDYVNFLPRIGFNPIGTISGQWNQSAWTSSSAQPGDIAVMRHGQYGHICMFTGWQWVSDFRQRNMWPYGGDGICTIFRFNGTIDPSLGSLVGNFGAGFDQNGYLTVLEDKHFMLSTERKDQKDNQLMEDLSFIYKSILDHCVLDELYGERECILKEPKFGTKEKIEKATKKDEDEHVQYLNELTSDDSTISESIVEAMLLYISSASTGNSIQVMDPGQLQIMMSAMNVGESGLSDSMVNQISMFEANKPFGYAMTDKDLNGYNAGDNQRTYGYGLVYYPGGKYKMSQIKTKWTQKDLESTYLAALKERTNKVLKWATKNKLVLNQHQIDALVCIHYNINGFFTDNRYSKLRQMIINDPKDQNIKNEWAHLSDWQTKFPGLKKRRALEAEWFMA